MSFPTIQNPKSGHLLQNLDAPLVVLDKIDRLALKAAAEDKVQKHWKEELEKSRSIGKAGQFNGFRPATSPAQVQCADYLEKFQELIDSYNAGSRNIEEIFKELLDLSSVLTKEQTRHGART